MEVTADGASCARSTQSARGFLRFFAEMPDPRGRNAIHKLHDMVVIAVMAVVCGAEGWADVELFGKSKQKWLATFLELPDGIPSHDTFGRVFALLAPDAFERCFMAWMGALVELAGGRLVAIDGKSLRRSFEHAWDKSGMAHMVSAFVNQGGNRLVFGQVTVQDKENEIVAIPRLLDLMDLNGAVVTTDAMGCQRDIAAKVVDGGGDYVLAVKDNQPALHKKAKALLDEVALGGIDGVPHGYFEESADSNNHGRIETRRVWVTGAVGGLGKDLVALWKGLGSVVLVETTRQDLSDPSGKVSTERRYYISSLKGSDDEAAKFVAGCIRGHWSVENNLHWQLDVTFREDERRIRKGHGAENFSRLCRLALNLAKRDKSIKNGVKAKRLKAGWDENYLLRLIGQ